ncbi:MAG: cytochrome C peroxidase, partial [Gemmatimonadetes bacterium]|nr:cytochrome C peroxidase [Gemmatimonadota bacterium]MYB69599.1 cytochrome C peroxidase [Gemmatimonadota bacterium]
MNKLRYLVSAAALTLLASAVSAPGQEDDLRQRFGLQPVPPVPYPENNTYNPARVELGRLLFFDPILSGEKDTACGTCHLPTFGLADGLPLAVGVGGQGLGPG